MPAQLQASAGTCLTVCRAWLDLVNIGLVLRKQSGT